MRKITFSLLLFGLAALLPARAAVLTYKPLPSGGLRFQTTRNITLQLTTTGLKTPPLKRTLLQTEIYRESVAETSPDGTLSLVRQTETRQTSPKAGADSYLLPGTQSFFRLTNRGRVLSLRTFLNPASAEDQPLPAELDLSYLTLDLANLEIILLHSPLPGVDVPVNQVWTDNFRLPNFLGASVTPVTLTSRLLAITQYQGRDCAKIRTAFELPVYWQYPQILSEIDLPASSLENLRTKGRIMGRMEWLFDLKQGHLVHAEGPIEFSVKSDFYYIDSRKQTIDSCLNMALKSYNKIQLLETTTPAPEIP